MLYQLTNERVRELHSLHKQHPDNTIITIMDGKWFEILFKQEATWFAAGGVQKQAVQFTLRPLFRNY